MTRKTEHKEAYAVVRRDRQEGRHLDPDSTNPPSICGGEYDYAIKEIVLDVEVAIREVERLNGANSSPNTRYFWQGTRLLLDGGSFGEGPGAS